MPRKPEESIVPVQFPLYRGDRRIRIALAGMPTAGKSTLFRAVSSTSVQSGELKGTDSTYKRCIVQIGLDEASVVDLPSVNSFFDVAGADIPALKYLLWGDQLPPVSAHEGTGPVAPFAPPDVIIQVADANALDRHLEMTLELCQLGRPVVLALNRMDEARVRGTFIDSEELGRKLGLPVVETIAIQGHGIAKLFETAVKAVRDRQVPHALVSAPHIRRALEPIEAKLDNPDVERAFRVPLPFLVNQVAAGNAWFMGEFRMHFTELTGELEGLRTSAGGQLPRPLEEELHADRHHRAATLFESISRLGSGEKRKGWRYWLDELFLDPNWGLFGSMLVFGLVLFMVFEVGTWLDGLSAARLIEMAEGWQPDTTSGVVGRAIVDGFIGLVGIVIPYMIPLVLLLVALEEMGIMHRIAFVLDRAFHKIGLHGSIAVPFLLGLGCNVPALSAAASAAKGKERVVASLLITFVPCSARSAIILALAGKYLGGIGVLVIFLLTMVVIAALGKLLGKFYPERGPGQVQVIPPYALPNLKRALGTTWERTSDILTIVTPLLVAGSVVLALLGHYGADNAVNLLLTPITDWWLGLPVVLGVPILFGILRKELSLLMIYQALGSFEVGDYLDWIQITTFLIFLTFYIPCVSTFAVMLKTIGKRDALVSVSLSVGVALVVAGLVRLILEIFRLTVL